MSGTDWLQEPAWVKSAIDPHKNRRAQHSLADNIWCQRGKQRPVPTGCLQERAIPGELLAWDVAFRVFFFFFRCSYLTLFLFSGEKEMPAKQCSFNKYLFISYCVTSTRSITKHNVFIRLPEEIHAGIAQTPQEPEKRKINKSPSHPERFPLGLRFRNQTS